MGGAKRAGDVWEASAREVMVDEARRNENRSLSSSMRRCEEARWRSGEEGREREEIARERVG